MKTLKDFILAAGATQAQAELMQDFRHAYEAFAVKRRPVFEGD